MDNIVLEEQKPITIRSKVKEGFVMRIFAHELMGEDIIDEGMDIDEVPLIPLGDNISTSNDLSINEDMVNGKEVHTSEIVRTSDIEDAGSNIEEIRTNYDMVISEVVVISEDTDENVKTGENSLPYQHVLIDEDVQTSVDVFTCVDIQSSQNITDVHLIEDNMVADLDAQTSESEQMQMPKNTIVGNTGFVAVDSEEASKICQANVKSLTGKKNISAGIGIGKSNSKKVQERAKLLKILPRPCPQTTPTSNTLISGHTLGSPEKTLLLCKPQGENTKTSPISPTKRLSLSLQDKIAIIKDLERGEKQSTVCKRKRLPKSTVQSIWKNKEKVLESVAKIGETKKRCRYAQYEDVEEQLIEWVDCLKSQSVPVNGPLLKAKAQVLAKSMGISDFRCSTGWLDKFKTRHNISFKKSVKSPRPCGAGDKRTALEWVTKIWPTYCEGYSPEDIFNADEVALFYKAAPDASPKLKSETCHGGKMAKERTTILLCANSVGTEKLKPVVIGCQQNPKSFTWVSKLDNLPVDYNYDPKSWMTKDIFEYWLCLWDKILKPRGRKILLIVDNTPAHVINVPLTNIKLVCLPPIVASILQPLEHGVTKFFKTRYRYLLLDRLIRKCEEMETTVHPNISLLESISMVHAAWEEVSSHLIASCFKNSNLQSLNVSKISPLIFTQTTKLQEHDDDRLLLEQAIKCGLNIPNNFSLQSYTLIDASLHVTDYCNLEINGMDNMCLNFKQDENDSDDEFLQNIVIPSRRDVQMFIDAIRNWAMISNENCDYSVHRALGVLEGFASHQSNLKAILPVSYGDSNGFCGTQNSPNVNAHGGSTSVPVSSTDSTDSVSSIVNSINSTQTVFYTPNFGTADVSHRQSEQAVLAMSVNSSKPKSQSVVNVGNHSNSTVASLEQAIGDASTSQNILQQQQFFTFLG